VLWLLHRSAWVQIITSRKH